MSWQAIADHVAAWSTLGAVIVALGLGTIAERRANSDRRAAAATQAEQYELQKRAQASQVSAWMKARRTSSDTAWAELVVQNASSEPVWNVVVDFYEIGDEDAETGELGENSASWRLGVLPPGVSRTREAPWTPPADDEPLGVSFRDNANSWWLRSDVGHLLPLSRDPYADD